MIRIEIEIWLYCADGSEKEGHCITSIHDHNIISKIAEICEGAVDSFYDAKYTVDTSSKSECLDVVDVIFNDGSSLYIHTNRRLDQFRQFDYFRLCYPDIVGKYGISKLVVNGIEFKDRHDAQEFIDYLVSHSGINVADIDIDSFKINESIDTELCNKFMLARALD